MSLASENPAADDEVIPDAMAYASDGDHDDEPADGVEMNDKDDEDEEGEAADDLASISTADTIDQKSKVTRLNINKLVQWSGYQKKQAVLLFRPDGIMKKMAELKTMGEKYHMSFKMYKTECKLVRNTLLCHGFHETHPNSNEFSLLWTGSHLRPYVLRALTEYQKVNHFPRSYEITRKDRLYRNVQRMQQLKGFKHFDFVPLSFICPGEFQDFCSAYLREKGTWIVKPIASSRGRGIFLVNHPDQLPLDETYIVSKYLGKPLLIDGFKFDLRLYVAVTSYDPLVIYLYEEGLSRFATVRYDQRGPKHIKNHCMHLTNYSVNKKSGDFVQNEDAEVEDYGNKWSLGALLRCLRAEGHDTTAIMMKIEDVIIKTIISVETPVATACKMFMPHKGNCFEVYGFDILLDSALRPWVLEVNLSPSLACDAPIDLKIKSNMIADLFSLTGFVLHDPMLRTQQLTKRNQEQASKNPLRQQPPDEVNNNNANNHSTSPITSRPTSIERPLTSEPIITDMYGCMTAPVDFKPYEPAIAPAPIPSMSPAQRRLARMGHMRYPKPGTPYTNGVCDLQNAYSHDKPSKCSRPGSAAFARRVSSAHHTSQQRSQSLTRSDSRHSSRNGRMRATTATPGSRGDGPPPLTNEEIRMIRRVKEEHARRGGWVRVFPTMESWDLYSQFLQYPSTNNQVLHQRLFPERFSGGRVGSSSNKLRMNIHLTPSSGFVSHGSMEMERFITSAMQRTMMYERKLGTKLTGPRKTKRATTASSKEKSSPPLPPSAARKKTDKHDPVSSTKPLTQGLPAKQDLEIGEPSLGRSELTMQEKPVAKVEPVQAERSESTEEKITSKPPVQAVKPTMKSSHKLNLVAELKRGCILTKPQARYAFATYLTRVQYRLLSETAQGQAEDIELANEQMDLVLRFLKRAAVNLTQPFKVVVPSRRLPVNDRRRILAKQLGDFVHIYSKETDSMNGMRDHGPRTLNKKLTINQTELEEFINSAGEIELEHVLTTYTKINKSAAIFLGGSRSEHSESVSSRPPSGHSTQKTLTNSSGGSSRWVGGETSSVAASGSKADSVVDLMYNSKTQTPSKSSFGSACYIYSGKMSNRPSSASTARPSSGGIRSNRPSSASINRGQPDDSPSEFDKNMDEVNAALQKLTMRQQERNYYTSNVTKTRENTPYNNRSVRHRNLSESDAQKNTQSADAHHQQPTSHQNATTRANDAETFETFIQDNQVYDDEIVDAYSRATGVPSSGVFTPSQKSSQFEILKQQQQDKQHKLMAQSKALLEASKAKHQAMIAQAHAATKKIQDDSSGDGYHVPHPPSANQARAKSAGSALRNNRYTLQPARSTEDLEASFYSSLKYDTATGKAKVVK